MDYDEVQHEIFIRLQKLSIEYPDEVEVYIDENGEAEFEVEYDFFFDNLEKIFGI
tara:strand:- start:1796 stop:1960 length:165 start_codon:yes stop_codon:yes gene_type:complete